MPALNTGTQQVEKPVRFSGLDGVRVFEFVGLALLIALAMDAATECSFG